MNSEVVHCRLNACRNAETALVADGPFGISRPKFMAAGFTVLWQSGCDYYMTIFFSKYVQSPPCKSGL